MREGGFHFPGDWEEGCPGRQDGEMWSQEPGSIHCCLLTSHLALNPAFPRARSLPRWIPGQVSVRVEALEGGLEGEGCMLVDVGISLPFRSFPSSAPGAPGGDGQRGCQVQVLHRSLLSHLTELLSDSCPVPSPSPAPMALVKCLLYLPLGYPWLI